MKIPLKDQKQVIDDDTSAWDLSFVTQFNTDINILSFPVALV